MEWLSRNFLLLYFISILLLTINSLPVKAADFSEDYFFNVDVISVYDGDTFSVETEVWPQHFVKTNIRMYGIDTPETTWRAKCEKEKQLGIAAREFLKSLVTNAELSKLPMTITNIKKDKYSGRFVGKLFIGNIDISKELINRGYAVEYYGKGTKKDWCL